MPGGEPGDTTVKVLRRRGWADLEAPAGTDRARLIGLAPLAGTSGWHLWLAPTTAGPPRSSRDGPAVCSAGCRLPRWVLLVALGAAGSRGGCSSPVCQAERISRMSDAVSDGVLPTLTPAASRASFLACAVPDEPETMAPAWPMVLPSGAVKPAT